MRAIPWISSGRWRRRFRRSGGGTISLGSRELEQGREDGPLIHVGSQENYDNAEQAGPASLIFAAHRAGGLVTLEVWSLNGTQRRLPRTSVNTGCPSTRPPLFSATTSASPSRTRLTPRLSTGTL